MRAPRDSRYVPTPDWTPPTGDDPKLGRLDRIACGEGPCGTWLDGNWLPFAPNTRTPLPVNRGLVLEDGRTHDPHPDLVDDHWVFVASTWRPPPGRISPDNRWVVDLYGNVRALATPGSRHLSLPVEIDIPGVGRQPTSAMQFSSFVWGADGDHIIGPGRAFEGDAPYVLICVHVPTGQVAWVIPSPAGMMQQPTEPAGPGRCTAVVGAGRVLLVFDAVTGEVRREIPLGEDTTGQPPLALSPDGTRVLVGPGVVGESPRVLDTTTGEQVAMLPSTTEPVPGSGHAIAADNRHVLVNGHFRAAVEDLETGRTVFAMERAVRAVTRDMARLAWFDGDTLQVATWRPGHDARPVVRWQHPGIGDRWGRFAPDGSLLALYRQSMDVYDAETGAQLTPDPRPGPALTSVGWLADSRTLVTDGGLLLDADTLRVVDEMPALADGTVAVSPDGRRSAALERFRGVRDGDAWIDEPVSRLRVVDLDTRTLLADRSWDIEFGAHHLERPVFSPDGSRVCAGERVFDLDDGSEFALPARAGIETRADFAAFSRDGTRVALFGWRLLVLDLDANAELLFIPARPGPEGAREAGVAFSPDADHVVVFFSDDSFRWYALATRAEAEAPCGLDQVVPPLPLGVRGRHPTAALSPDGRRLALVAGDGVLCAYRRAGDNC